MLTHQHSYSSLEPTNYNENIPGHRNTGAGEGGEVQVAHTVGHDIGHFLESGSENVSLCAKIQVSLLEHGLFCPEHTQAQRIKIHQA